MNTIAHISNPVASRVRRRSVAHPVLPPDTSVVIRLERADDANALERLAQLGERALPQRPLLVAEISGELWAAMSLTDETAVADPFHPTAEIVALLRARADQLRARHGHKRRGRIRSPRPLTQWWPRAEETP